MSKVYGSRFSRLQVEAIKNISLKVFEGDILNITGKNGSGKTTLLLLAAGLLNPSGGRVTRSFKFKQRIPSARLGFCPDNPKPYSEITILNYLQFISKILDIPSSSKLIEAGLEDFQLLKWKNEQIGKLSKGMLHKVALLASMLDSPQLLILDEPFSSLDSEGSTVLIKRLEGLSSLGTGILISDLSKNISRITKQFFALDSWM